MHYSLSIFVGLIVFNFAAELVYRAPTLLHEHVHYIKKSIFPSEALVWIAMLPRRSSTRDQLRRIPADRALHDGRFRLTISFSRS